MFVPCPHCGFLVALIVSDGGPPQRCPRCEGLLQAGGDEGGDAEAAVEAAPAPAIAAAAPDTRDPIEAVIASAAADPPVSPEASEPAPLPPRRKRNAPSFARSSASAMPSGPRWPGLVAATVLLLVLALQLLLVQRNELAANARWRPVIGAVCAALQCELAPWREPAAFTMLNRGVQPDPRTPGVLVVQASFRNDAHWPQSWPTLLLSLSDVDGRAVGQRAFAPREYRGMAGPPLQLAPGQSASVRFAVVEPAPRIVAFNFDFR